MKRIVGNQNSEEGSALVIDSRIKIGWEAEGAGGWPKTTTRQPLKSYLGIARALD